MSLCAQYVAAAGAVRAAEAALARAEAEEAAWQQRLRTEHHSPAEVLHGCWNGAGATVRAGADLADARQRLDHVMEFIAQFKGEGGGAGGRDI